MVLLKNSTVLPLARLPTRAILHLLTLMFALAIIYPCWSWQISFFSFSWYLTLAAALGSAEAPAYIVNWVFQAPGIWISSSSSPFPGYGGRVSDVSYWMYWFPSHASCFSYVSASAPSKSVRARGWRSESSQLRWSDKLLVLLVFFERKKNKKWIFYV